MMSLDELVDQLNQSVTAMSEDESLGRASQPDVRLFKQIFSLEDLCLPSSDSQFVQGVYLSLLHREVDDGALAWYCDCLDRGERTRNAIILELLQSDEGKKVGCAVIGLTDGERIIAGLVKEVAGNSLRLAKIEAELKYIARRVEAIPKAQTVFLNAIYAYLSNLLETRSVS